MNRPGGGIKPPRQTKKIPDKARQRLFGNFAGVLLPLAGALLIPSLIIFAGSPDPGKSIAAFFVGPWSNSWFLGNTLDSAALLLTAALGAAFAFKGGCFNLGGEGQIYLGGCAAAAVLLVPSGTVPDPLLAASAGCAAAAVGALMGGASGLLRRTAGANELISSFLLSAALIPAGNFLVAGPLRGRTGNLLASEAFSSGRLLPKLLPPSVLSVSCLIALGLVVLAHLFIHYTSAGYCFRVSGAAPELARFGGITPEARFVPAMAVSGALSGLCGFFATAGTYGMAYSGFSGGMGWTAIAAALVAGNEMLALVPASLFLAALKSGSDSALLQAGFGFETAAFIQAAVLLLAALPLGKRFISRGKE
ncbi:MAG: ABC transporter permease [Treponema sp.]|jgi:simple sugar transport system permease protein|nr:ABC transporter permease [Treponema sp.]